MAYIKFTEDHEWIRIEGDVGTVGITVFAQEQLGDIVFIELPETGTTLSKGQQAGVIESVKAASEIYSPVGGDIVEANNSLADAPDTVNTEAEGAGWIFKIKVSNMSEFDNLMDETAYKEFIS
ncbi:MAG: Glycine cleavage system H protein [Alphaproteobacteria bacterium MarineAlpha4_Bin2]|nr:MAG: Glycine cleavage system H protein [Alphaproteobacteria bacterium MarineAlpha4_Bin2]